jgi:hypothetical protein
MSKSPQEIAAENGKPAKAERAPVIRRVFINDEDTASRVLNRHVPAWVISGGIHVLLIGAFVLFWKVDTKVSGNEDNKVVATKIEDKEKPQENFENEDLGLDAEIAAATNSPREEMEVVEGPTVPDEAIGAPNEQMEQPTQTFAPPGLGPNDLLKGSAADLSDAGKGLKGDLGGGSQFTMPGMKGRSGATKDRLIREGGGNTETEAAVARALAWIAKQQKTDGHWAFSEGDRKDEVAATGLAILPFLAAGYTHKPPLATDKDKDKKEKKEYTALVQRGITWLSGKQQSNGKFNMPGVTNYTQGIATIVFCELYGMTKDPNIKERAQKAVNYIVSVQETAGGWGYQPKDATSQDISIVGWQIQALRSARTSELNVPESAWKKSEDWLKGVSSDKETKYGYRSKTDPSITRSAVGLLCRQYMGWGPQNPSLAMGVEFLKTAVPDDSRWDMYYYYYATQVLHFFEGKDWFEVWNPAIKKVLLGRQVKGGANGGSWDADNQIFGNSTGRLGTTCLACLTLEVYYRHLPLYKRGAMPAE